MLGILKTKLRIYHSVYVICDEFLFDT